MTTLDPVIVDALIGLGGAAVGYVTHWWQSNRNNVVGALAEELGDALDSLEDLTGLDIPDEFEEQIEEVVEQAVETLEDVVEDASEAVSEAVADGDLSDVVEAITESVSESVAELDVSIEDLEDLTVAGLRERLNDLGIDITGRPRKAELIQMIVNHVNGGEME